MREQMVWKRVAQSYMGSFVSARADHKQHAHESYPLPIGGARVIDGLVSA